jgi:hypothetical protein
MSAFVDLFGLVMSLAEGDGVAALTPISKPIIFFNFNFFESMDKGECKSHLSISLCPFHLARL